VFGAVPADGPANRGNCWFPNVAALVDRDLDAGRCSGPSLNFLTTFQDLVLDSVFTFHYLLPDFP